MAEYLYKIIDERGNVIADGMKFDYAIIFLKALFEEYYNEENLVFSLERYSNAVKCVDEDEPRVG